MNSPLFGEGYFTDVYPQVVKLSIEGKQYHNDPTKKEGIDGSCRYNQCSFVNRVSCKNKECNKGGFDLGRFVGDMIYNRQTDLKGGINCEGNEGAKRTQWGNPKCGYRLDVEVHIEYKDNDD